MKRVLAVLIVFAMAFAMVACSSGSTNSTAPSTAAGSAENTSTSEGSATGSGDGNLSGSLVIWEGQPERGVCAEAYIKLLSPRYPNVKFSYETKTEVTYNNALATAFAAGGGPDVFWNWGTKNAILGTQQREGYIIPLTDIVDMSLFEPDGKQTMITSICYIDNVLYAVPTSSIDTRTVYYNTELFQQKGYAVPKNLGEFEALCDKMLGDGIQPLTLAATEWSSIMHVWDFLMCTQDGGPDFFNRLIEKKAKFNEDVNVKGLQLLLNWRDKGYFSKSSTANDASSAIMEFATGGTGMIICGSWQLETVRSSNKNLKFDVFKIPNVADGKIYACTTANGGYSIAKNTKNPDVAKMFIQWMATVEGQQTYINSNHSCPALAATPSSDEVATKIGSADVLLGSNEERVFLTGDKTANVFEENLVNVFGGLIDAQKFCDMVAAEQNKLDQ
jgi:raffinose/stachyose/melibiose transport system substrate-binding protein